MLKGLPFYIPLLFIFTTLITFLFFIAAVKKNNYAVVGVFTLLS